MLFPSLIVDNFFDEPDNIVHFSKSLSFNSDGKSPGKRTKNLAQIDYSFFNWVNTKILALLYPQDITNIRYNALATFQKVPPNLKFNNWVHEDTSSQITAILYLSKNNNVGTSIYKNKKLSSVLDLNQQIKYKYFIDSNIKDQRYLDDLNTEYKNNQSNFEETLKVNGIYNRLFLFDSWNYHAAHKFVSKNNKLERLTYIVFFNDIYCANKQLQYPIPVMKRIK